jgi:hypothetical protein
MEVWDSTLRSVWRVSASASAPPIGSGDCERPLGTDFRRRHVLPEHSGGVGADWRTLRAPIGHGGHCHDRWFMAAPRHPCSRPLGEERWSPASQWVACTWPRLRDRARWADFRMGRTAHRVYRSRLPRFVRLRASPPLSPEPDTTMLRSSWRPPRPASQGNPCMTTPRQG